MPLSLKNGARLVAATHNPGKVREISALLDGRFDVVSAGDLGLPEPAVGAVTRSTATRLRQDGLLSGAGSAGGLSLRHSSALWPVTAST